MGKRGCSVDSGEVDIFELIQNKESGFCVDETKEFVIFLVFFLDGEFRKLGSFKFVFG